MTKNETLHQKKQELIKYFKSQINRPYDNFDHYASEHTCPVCQEIGFDFDDNLEVFVCDVCGHSEDVFGNVLPSCLEEQSND